MYSDFPPFEYIKNKQSVGMNIEIIKEVCRRLNVTPKFNKLPWKRALEMVKQGRADAIFSLFKNEERVNYYNYPEQSINSVKMVIVTTKKRNIRITKIEDLKGLKVGVYRGSSYGNEFDTSNWIIKDIAKDNETLLNKQLVGRTDAFVMDERVVKYLSKKLDIDDIFYTQP